MKFATTAFVALSSVSAAAADSYQCPGSDAWVYAWAEVSFTTTVDCVTAKAEIEARVAGTQDGTWTDPHNGGTYSNSEDIHTYLELSRTTANGQYTDKMDFTFTDSGFFCEVTGCSESQVTSIADFSTNYCNLKMLYCGEPDGCVDVNGNIDAQESEVKHSTGASAKLSDCFPSTSSTKDHTFADSVLAVGSSVTHSVAEPVAEPKLRGTN